LSAFAGLGTGRFEWIPAFAGMTKTGLATVMLGLSVLRFRKSLD
jgi:hypothetical protein